MRKFLFAVILAIGAVCFAGHRWLGWWRGEPEGGAGPVGGEVQPPVEIPLEERADALARNIAELKSGNRENARAALEKTAATEKDFQLRARAALELGSCLMEEGKELEGFRSLSLAVRFGQGNDRDAALKAAAAVVDRYFFSPAPTPNSTVYEVKPGDVLSKIEIQHASSVGLIMLANSLQSDRIYEGQRLKVPAGPVELVIDKSEHLMMVFAGGCYVKEYPVGVGAHDQTPEGTFTIKPGSKLKNPDWYKPGEPKPIPFGDPRNILGTRWLGFQESPVIGIHGIRKGEEDSIGKDMSAGCIRMFNRDVEELFDIVPGGSKVDVRM